MKERGAVTAERQDLELAPDNNLASHVIFAAARAQSRASGDRTQGTAGAVPLGNNVGRFYVCANGTAHSYFKALIGSILKA